MPLSRVDTASTNASFTTARSTISDDDASSQISPRAALLPKRFPSDARHPSIASSSSATPSSATPRVSSTISYCSIPRSSLSAPTRSSTLSPTMSDDEIVRTESGLEVLAPSPTEPSTPIDETSDPSSSSSSSQNNTTFFGLRRRNPAQILQSLQKYSSYAFSIFAAFHVTNTAVLPLVSRLLSDSNTAATQDASQYLLLTRPYYQSPVAEPVVVLLPLVTHIASGIALRLYKRHILLKHYGGYTPLLPAYSKEDRARWRTAPWPKTSWQQMAGYVAIPLVLGHSFITRGLPLRVEGGSSGIGLDYVSHGFAIAPKLHVLGYVALVGVVGSHVVWGWAKWLGLAPKEAVQGETQERQLERRTRWWEVWSVAGAVVGIWVAGGVGVVGRAGLEGRVPGWVGRVYDGLYRELPIISGWV